MAIGVDPQFGEVAAVMAVVVRIIDWAVRDLDRLRLPEELFEVIPSQAVVPRIGFGAGGADDRGAFRRGGG
jgi:hypothetical protein